MTELTLGCPRERSVLPRIGSLCTGYGGLDLGAATALGGAHLVWVADTDRDIEALLAARFPGVVNLGDITQVDWRHVPAVDVLTAGFPCQDVSIAGRGAGIQRGNRSGLWFHIIEAVRQLRPPLVVVENVAALRGANRGLGRVLGDLAEARYDAAWTSVRASDIGAPHRRERVFVLAHQYQSRQIGGHRTAGSRARCRCAQGGAIADAVGLDLRRRRGSDGLARPPGTAQGPRLPTRTHPADGHHHHCHARSCPPLPAAETQFNWGPYEAAVRHWEDQLGRPAPHPLEPGRRDRLRLAAPFVEWMMGLDPGWVTEIDISRRAQLRALGNGVVPQQAACAVRHLLDLTGREQFADPNDHHSQASRGQHSSGTSHRAQRVSRTLRSEGGRR